MRDCDLKGRRNPRRGEAHQNHVLSEKKVAQIRELAAEGWSQRKLARRFMVSQPNILYVLNGRTWKHTRATPDAQ
jgi:hypothetical protein